MVGRRRTIVKNMKWHLVIPCCPRKDISRILFFSCSNFRMVLMVFLSVKPKVFSCRKTGFRPKNFPSIIMSIFDSRQSKETTEYSNVVGDFFWSFQIVLKPQKWREIDSRGRGAHISKLNFVLSPKSGFGGLKSWGRRSRRSSFCGSAVGVSNPVVARRPSTTRQF